MKLLNGGAWARKAAMYKSVSGQEASASFTTTPPRDCHALAVHKFSVYWVRRGGGGGRQQLSSLEARLIEPL